jgi:hypothetical protein
MTRKKSKVSVVVEKSSFDSTLKAMISAKPLKIKDITKSVQKPWKVIGPRT